MIKANFFALGVLAALISFLGFVVENLWLELTKGYINNRNMNLPFLLGYGCLVIVMYLCFGTPDHIVLPFGISVGTSKFKNYLAYFLVAMLFVSVSEIVLGYLVEKFCCFEYWNYEWVPLHITKYTSIPTSMGFAAMITFFMGNCFSPLLGMIMKMEEHRMQILSALLVTIMVVDFIVSFAYMIKHKDFNLKWKIVFKGKVPQLEILR